MRARGRGRHSAPSRRGLQASTAAEHRRCQSSSAEERARSGAGGLTRSAKCPPRPPVVGARIPWTGMGCGPQAGAAPHTQPLLTPSSRLPVHAVAEPGITDSWAMPRVPPSAPLLGCASCHPAPPPEAPHPQPGPGRTRARRTQKQGSLRISLTSGRSPPTKPRDWGGGSPCRPVGGGLPGTLPPAGTLCRGRRAGREPGVRRGEGPGLRATAR